MPPFPIQGHILWWNTQIVMWTGPSGHQTQRSVCKHSGVVSEHRQVCTPITVLAHHKHQFTFRYLSLLTTSVQTDHCTCSPPVCSTVSSDFLVCCPAMCSKITCKLVVSEHSDLCANWWWVNTVIGLQTGGEWTQWLVCKLVVSEHSDLCANWWWVNTVIGLQTGGKWTQWSVYKLVVSEHSDRSTNWWWVNTVIGLQTGGEWTQW